MSDQYLPTKAAPEPGASAFDSIKQIDENGQEYWLARELAKALGYTGRDSWKNFERVITEARTVAQSQGHDVERLFADAGKKSSGGRPAQDYRLTRMACYLVALSAEGSKPKVAAAKVYFAIMTREREELQELAYHLDNLEIEMGLRQMLQQLQGICGDRCTIRSLCMKAVPHFRCKMDTICLAAILRSASA